MILFDTSVLSHVLRRSRPGTKEEQLRKTLENMMVEEDDLGLPGIVLQEILTGIRSDRQFEELKSLLLASFRIVLPQTADHVQAARLKNKCLSEGLSVSGPDCLIATITIGGGHVLYTLDSDFASIARLAPLNLYHPR